MLATGGPAEVLLAAADGAALVVLKRLSIESRDPDAVARFRQAAEIAASLEHPNIARIYDVIPGDAACTIVMEYVPGEDLRTLLRGVAASAQAIPLRVTCAIIDGVAAGLAVAHDGVTGEGAPQVVVHGDVSPSNLIITYDGRVKIVDFGLAGATRPHLSADPVRLRGKLPYASPELVDGRSVDHRADLFALGAVAWEMLTSLQLFTGSRQAATIRSILEGDVPPPSDYNPEVPVEIDELVLALLRRDVHSRLSSARELRQGLARAVCLDEPAEELIAGWMRSTFEGSRALRSAVEEGALWDAAHGIEYSGAELPLAFPGPHELAPRGPDERLRRRQTSSAEMVIYTPLALPAPSPSRDRFSRGALMVMLSVALLFPPLIVVLLRLATSEPAGAAAPPTPAAVRPLRPLSPSRDVSGAPAVGPAMSSPPASEPARRAVDRGVAAERVGSAVQGAVQEPAEPRQPPGAATDAPARRATRVEGGPAGQHAAAKRARKRDENVWEQEPDVAPEEVPKPPVADQARVPSPPTAPVVPGPDGRETESNPYLYK